MTFKTLLKSMVLSAGLCIFAVGLVVAQTPPPAQPTAPLESTPPSASPEPRAGQRIPFTDREIRDTCDVEIQAGSATRERRIALRECTRDKRRARDEAREASQEDWLSCRRQLRNERFTEDERHEALLDCAAKRNPFFVQQRDCWREGREKKLEQESWQFRSHMRACMTRG